MRKLYVLLFVILILGVLLAYLATFGKLNISPNYSLPSFTDTTSYTPMRGSEYPIETDIVTIDIVDSAISITNKSANSIGYTILETEVAKRVEWEPCVSAVECPSISPEEVIEASSVLYSRGETVALFWWEQLYNAETDTYSAGEIHSHEISFN